MFKQDLMLFHVELVRQIVTKKKNMFKGDVRSCAGIRNILYTIIFDFEANWTILSWKKRVTYVEIRVRE